MQLNKKTGVVKKRRHEKSNAEISENKDFEVLYDKLFGGPWFSIKEEWREREIELYEKSINEKYGFVFGFSKNVPNTMRLNGSPLVNLPMLFELVSRSENQDFKKGVYRGIEELIKEKR